MRIDVYLIVFPDGDVRLAKRRPRTLPWGGAMIPVHLTVPSPAVLDGIDIDLTQIVSVEAGVDEIVVQEADTDTEATWADSSLEC